MHIVFQYAGGDTSVTRFSRIWKLAGTCSHISPKLGYISLGFNRGHRSIDKPINQRFVRPEQPRIAPFVVLEGPDFAGKTFHAEGVSLWLSKQGFAVQTLIFPSNQTLFGRF